MSSAKIVVFRHNDVRDLEFKLRREIIKAHRLRKPWDKIFIVVEGVYSMHGSMVKLPEVIQIKEKYGAYLYLDEAHCMGGLGANGKGVTQYFGVDPNKVDILMGTFAKSFGAIGGYIAGSKKLINLLRRRSNAHHYGTAMPAAVAAFILEGITFLSTNLEGPARVLNLQRNTRYFRQKMEQMGYIISGHEDSPVVPVTITIGTLRYVVDFMRERNVAAVMVGYPASPLTEGRIRCCMSAQLTKDMIDHVLRCFQELSEQFDLRMSRRPRSKKEIEY
jgi:serine palmitoyltransferase